MEQVIKGLELFTIRPYRSKRLQQYFKHFSQDQLKVLVDDNVKDVLLAQGYSIEEVPRSIYKVEKLYEALSGYAPGKIPDVKIDDDVIAGISLAYACFARKKDDPVLRVMEFTPATIATITSNPSGSPGVTNYGCSKAESVTRALERGLQTLKGVKAPEPCLAFKRTQFNDKTRLVWGYPYSMTCVEGLVAYPLIQKFKGGCTPMAFAITTGALGSKLRVASYHKEYAYSLDMSQFDATLAKTLIMTAFDILETWFESSEIEPKSCLTVREIFKLCRRYFIYTPIIMPDGNLYLGKDHGVPSGSYFTQLIDSIVNTIIVGSISNKYHLNVSKRELFVLGDDILFWSNRKMDLDKIASYARSTFHVIMHGAEKSAVYHFDEPIHFLGRIWDKGIPDLPQEEIIARMVFPETYRKYDDDAHKKERQVKMLLLSYASTYRSAWEIAFNAIDGGKVNYHLGCQNLDVNTYITGRSDVDRERLDPNFTSGLQRYLAKYVYPRSHLDIPNTALLFWL